MRPPLFFGLWNGLDKKALGLREQGPLRVEDGRFGPVFSAVALQNAALDAKLNLSGNGAKVFDFQFAGNGGPALSTNSLAHGFVEQGSDDAAVEITGVAGEGAGNCREADDGAVGGEEEFETQTGGIGRAATEAAVAGRVGQGRELFTGFGHDCLAG